jgi:ceramide glucosyltransferase
VPAALAWIVEAAAGFGIVEHLAGYLALRGFRRPVSKPPLDRPKITLMKPLHGLDPLLEVALESTFHQDYPDYQIVFGLQDPLDPARPLVEALMARYPERDCALVIDATEHGANRKVSNLINMRRAAKHDLLIISDADIHVPKDFLSSVVAALEVPNTGLVTTLYTGLPAVAGLPAIFGASQINHVFLTGTLLARVFGRQDCLGVTMALTSRTLDAVGGFESLLPHLADDNVLGRKVRALGMDVGLARAMPATSIPETDFAALWRHEMRWARTIRALVPAGYAASILQYPLAWSLIALALSGFAPAFWLVFAAFVACRYALARGVERAMGLPKLGDAWLLVLRDCFSFAVFLGSFASNRVTWRGRHLQADSGRPL